MNEQSDVESEHPIALASFLTALKPLILHLATRQYHMHQACPLLSISETDHQKTVRAIAECNVTIDGDIERLRTIEEETGGEIGVSALIGKAADSNFLFCATAVLFASRVGGASLYYETRKLQDLASWSAGTESVGALIVRDSLRMNGVLFPHVRIDNADMGPIDCAGVEMLDASVATICGRSPDPLEIAAAVYARNQTIEVKPRRRKLI